MAITSTETGEPEPEPDSTICIQHGLHYVPATHAGCVLCRRVTTPSAPHGWNELRSLFVYFLLLLAVQAATMIYVHLTRAEVTAQIAATAAFAVLTIGFALPRSASLASAYRNAGFSLAGYLWVLALAPVIVALVGAYVRALTTFFGVHNPNELGALGECHLAWAILLVAIAPPLQEELGFRGVVYGGLLRSMGVTETFVVSSFAFAIIHLSVPSLVTHFPLGLYLCWLRHRSGCLWPPTFAHFCHNLLVVLAERNGWL